MASFAEILEIIIHADSAQAVASLTKTAGASDALGVKTTRLGKLGMSSGAMYAAGAALVVGGLYQAAKAADAEHLSLLKLQNSMKNNPMLAGASQKAFLDLADSLHQVTVVDDNVVVETEAMLGTFRLTQDEILKLTPLVVDYARKFDVDVVSAAKSVGKATDGQVAALRRNGVTIDEVRFKTDRYGAVVEALRGQVGGFAEKEGKTFSGQMQILKNNLMDIAETIGSVVLPVFTALAGAVVPAINVAKDLGADYILAGAAIGSAVGPIGTVVGASLGAAGKALEAGKEDIKKYREAYESSNGAIYGMIKPSEYARIVMENLGEAHKTAAEKIKASTQQIQASTDATWAKIDADLALQGSVLGSFRAVETYNKVLLDGKSSALDRAEAELRVKQAFQQQAKAAGEEAVAGLGKHAGAAAVTAARNKAMAETFANLANGLAPGSPLRVYLEGTIRQINSIPGTKNVRVGMDDSGFMSRLPGLRAYLAGIGRSYAKPSIGLSGGGGSGLFFDKGGVVPGPKGMPQLAVVHGGETIYPTHKSHAMAMAGGSSSVQYSINVNAGMGADPAEIGRVAVDAIRAYERRSGKAWRN